MAKNRRLLQGANCVGGNKWGHIAVFEITVSRARCLK